MSTCRSASVLLLLFLLFAGAIPAFALTLGDALALDQPTPISTILASPDDYVGQKVQVQGMVLDVCAKRGCWIYLAGDRPFEKIRVKVDDGVIVFPMEARGKQAVVEGVIEKFVLSREEVIDRRRHHAEEQGVAFDPATVTSGETFYQIRGQGAEIRGL